MIGKAGLAAALMVAGSTAQAEDAFVDFKALKPEVALKAAVAAMTHCRDEGYQVGVAVVDRFGTMQAFIRDRFAGAHVEETARRKAWTAASFRTDTMALGDLTAPGTLFSGIRDLSEPLALGGGVPIEHGGSLVGGIGVSGAPGPDLDDVCARRGIAAIEEDMGF
ncbi:putative extracellular protein [Rhodovulum sp. P5]|uniref:GlcG/HbpS family heme-binding protein n=1 Tax=Rhodovulum sp. P5 TaxID=1564506 RepID=UPI0009C314A3|nr:heme-binding protein [Rhodovulum sp. P5]ARE41562.1 putative extracellular protein [Rhodovulum sp. P5]